MVEHLPSKPEALSSFSNRGRKEGRKERRKERREGGRKKKKGGKNFLKMDQLM
jgi:hypothetical protein